MTRHLRPTLVFLLLFTLLLGILYPLATLSIGQIAMPRQANGSLAVVDGKVIGSDIIGQSFTQPVYFHGRPSAAGSGYDATASSGSNLGPASKALIERTRASVAAARADGATGALPPDLVTASASGLDPDISPEAAIAQVQRVAKARGIATSEVRTLVESSTSQPLLGILGEPRVNVLAINRQLDRMAPQPRR